MELASAVLLDEAYLQQALDEAAWGMCQVCQCLGFKDLLHLARGNCSCWRHTVGVLPNLAPRAFAQLSITEKAEVLRFLAAIEAAGGEGSLLVG